MPVHRGSHSNQLSHDVDKRISILYGSVLIRWMAFIHRMCHHSDLLLRKSLYSPSDIYTAFSHIFYSNFSYDCCISKTDSFGNKYRVKKTYSFIHSLIFIHSYFSFDFDAMRCCFFLLLFYFFIIFILRLFDKVDYYVFLRLLHIHNKIIFHSQENGVIKI